MIEAVIQRWAREHQLSAGGDLEGFLMDVEFHASVEDRFSSCALTVSTDPISRVLGLITTAPGGESLQMISGAFRRLWSEIAYGEFQASSVAWFREATVLRFVTGTTTGLGVTGTLYAAGDDYPNLVARFERNFGALPRFPRELATRYTMLGSARGG